MNELRRRTKAAAAYADLDLQALAKRLDMSYSTLKRKLDKKTWRRYERVEFIRALADACRLPYEFFTVDFTALPQLVEDEDLSPRGQEIMKRLYEVIEELQANIPQLSETPSPEGEPPILDGDGS